MVLKIAIELLLLLVFFQDLRERAVFWILFPVLALSFLSYRLLRNDPVAAICQAALVNIGFIAVVFLLLTAYFSVKRRKWTNVTDGLLGLGDLLFLLALCFYFSILNFLLFYITSLILVLATWLIWRSVVKNSNEVPLAGLQAVLLAILLGLSWWVLPVDLTNDNWILRLMYN
ncbi:MAG: hypothetical protein M3O71_21505 [Bacteroidota bacterium]|nr:hypothetical protein [Bacteroidota bacterium]